MKQTSGTHTMLGRLFALLLVFTLVAAACSSSSDDGGVSSGDDSSADTTDDGSADDSSADDSSADTTDDGSADDSSDDGSADDSMAGDDDAMAELTASYKGVTAESINVGVTMLDFDAMAELSLVQNGWGDQQGVHQAFVDEINARGGINGRMIVPTYAFYSPLGVTEAEAACVVVTQDTVNFAVLGGFLGPAVAANPCLTGTNDTMVVGGTPTEELLGQSTAPWVLPGGQLEDLLPGLINLLGTEGLLDGKTVTIVGSTEFASIVPQAEAIFTEKGVNVAEVLDVDVPQGDILAENDLWSVLAERIASNGSDAVFVIGSGQSAVRGIDANGLDVDVWVLNSQDLNNLGAETPKETAEGAITITGLTDDEQWEHPTMVECREIIEAAFPDAEIVAPGEHVDGESEEWFNSIMNYCAYWRLFEEIATGAGPDLTYDSVNATIEGLSDFSLPGFPFASLAADKVGANDAYRLSVFDPNVGETGSLVPLTDVLDATP